MLDLDPADPNNRIAIMPREILPSWFIGYVIPVSAISSSMPASTILSRTIRLTAITPEAMQLFNKFNGVTNHQQAGEDLSAQLARLDVHPRAVFFTHLHPDHTGGVPALDSQTKLVFGRNQASFLARAAIGNHFSPAKRTLPLLIS